MRPLFTEQELASAKANAELPLECERCGKTFHKRAKFIRSTIKLGKKRHKYCGPTCMAESFCTSVTSPCGNCGKQVTRQLKESKKSKSGLSFCCQSCAATYSNTHKTTGNRRSKLERWLEEQLTALYPSLQIDYNKTSAINSELDIYIPALALAFELNGIFHYEPIYGPEKLASIQNNDTRKFQACLERQIELTIIDSSSLSYFKPSRAQKYLDMIRTIIDAKIARVG